MIAVRIVHRGIGRTDIHGAHAAVAAHVRRHGLPEPHREIGGSDALLIGPACDSGSGDDEREAEQQTKSRRGHRGVPYRPAPGRARYTNTSVHQTEQREVRARNQPPNKLNWRRALHLALPSHLQHRARRFETISEDAIGVRNLAGRAIDQRCGARTLTKPVGFFLHVCAVILGIA